MERETNWFICEITEAVKRQSRAAAKKKGLSRIKSFHTCPEVCVYTTLRDGWCAHKQDAFKCKELRKHISSKEMKALVRDIKRRVKDSELNKLKERAAKGHEPTQLGSAPEHTLNRHFRIRPKLDDEEGAHIRDDDGNYIVIQETVIPGKGTDKSELNVIPAWAYQLKKEKQDGYKDRVPEEHRKLSNRTICDGPVQYESEPTIGLTQQKETSLRPNNNNDESVLRRRPRSLAIREPKKPSG